jgi:preprotein translocase subunit SecA
VFGFLRNLWDSNEKELRRLRQIVDVINGLEPEISALQDSELRAKTNVFRSRIETGESLDSILPEAFAVAREASRRITGMRHFDVQLMGGIVLHEGKIAEMKTGEGKTLVAVLPAYLHGLTEKGVHIVTVNDYLAERDRDWMGPIYEFLGLSTGVIVHDMDYDERKKAYAADITYGTNNEFGFDYLRDNMAVSPENLVQRDLYYAIVDEVDSILIDEARTPLIISGVAGGSTDLYYRLAKTIPRLRAEEHYVVDEKAHSATLTEEGVRVLEDMLKIENLFDSENMDMAHYVNQALKAHALMKRDRDYVVKDDQVIIVDEFTGRLMFGRRYSDGLHQSIEAKEGVRIEEETQTLASITFQNYFRMYDILSGMTGTAETEEQEFIKVYDLPVVVIPTNEPMIRIDYPDFVYKTEEAKFRAVAKEIAELYEKGRPVLVGTISIEKSEMVSRMLTKKNIPHEVLNAKHHEREAQIISQAGQKGTVTIATNMAGRGADIVLGEGVKELGGLHIIGTERHESRRIDNQLRGRAGRQGDPGSSRFYVSLEDDLMRLFGSDRIVGIMNRLGWDEDQPIEHSQVSRAIESAQKKVEAHNFDIRKHLLEYDDVMNQQRSVIYDQREEVLTGGNLKERILDIADVVIGHVVDGYATEKIYPEDWDLDGLVRAFSDVLAGSTTISVDQLQKLDSNGLKDLLQAEVRRAYDSREAETGSDVMRILERGIMLRVIDSKWMDHLYAMDSLREGISLRAYGQRDPLVEYKYEAYDIFQMMIASIQEEIVRLIFKVRLADPARGIQHREISGKANLRDSSASAGFGGSNVSSASQGITQRRVQKIGRNELCPCGSGRKYKKCCGRKASSMS